MRDVSRGFECQKNSIVDLGCKDYSRVGLFSHIAICFIFTNSKHHPDLLKLNQIEIHHTENLHYLQCVYSNLTGPLYN